MLCCETAGATAQDVEDLAVFASQLAALGLDARIHVGTVPEGLPRNGLYDLAPHLVDAALGPEDALILVAAHRLTDARLVELRRLAGPEPVRCRAIGAFPSRQAVIGTTAKLSYVFGTDPQIVDLGPEAEGRPGAPVFGVEAPRRRSGPRPPRLLLIAPALADLRETRALQALALSGTVTPAVLTDGDSKGAWIEAHGHSIPIFHFGEVLPAGLARRVDLCVAYGALPTSYRTQCLLANLAVSGVPVVDGTELHRIAASSDAVIPGPPDVATLMPFLAERILPNLTALETQIRRSRAALDAAPGDLLGRLGLGRGRTARRRPRPAPAEGPARVVFMPTNGIGLGHAQRCGLIARALDPARIAPAFAAFPGCLRLVKAHGFDAMPLVSRSTHHARPFENDLPNYLRLRALATDARALVFDGGYVFDSVYRTVIETGVRGIWIRRGLWQSGQDNSIALDREKAFARVIVPGEPFPELNRDYSRGPHLSPVGPIVGEGRPSAPARKRLRAGLAERYGLPFDRLVVSLLGAGVAADRSAQIQALSGLLERRGDTLHLVVVWPSAVMQPAWFAWRRTRVVKTLHASALAAAADLLVTAAGYNSFLEVLYGRIPAIFIPQMGPFMDDQRSRAQAAVEREVASLVEPTELVALERQVGLMLDGGAEAMRARLAGLELPEPGNAAAARLIEEDAR